MATASIKTKRCREDIVRPLAKRHLKRVLGKGELLRIDKNCKYYPCHYGGLEDCTFCSYPFYPSGDESTGGKWIKGTSWSIAQLRSSMSCYRKE
ncbi:MAG: hypothetical protein IMY87_07010 [Chloroflexi bacterium]|nr:hypothetical protein [Chloroflexota bacterium]